jgi:hypothetical protein
LKEGKKYIQQVIGIFLYNGQVVDSTMLTPPSSIASMQAKPTEEPMTKTKNPNHAATHHNAIITY